MQSTWSVELSRDALKQYEKLKRSGLKKPSIIDTIDLLMADLEQNGPEAKTWPHYGIIEKGKKSYYHCHLKKGRPTMIACWDVTDKKTKQIEVFYVGSHENSPY